MSLPENMPSPGMDSPYILRLLFPDRNADRNARALPGSGVFRSTTSGVAGTVGQPPLGSLHPGTGQPPRSQPPLGSLAPRFVSHPWGRWHMSQPPLGSLAHESTTSGVNHLCGQPPLGSLHHQESTNSGVTAPRHRSTTSEVADTEVLNHHGACQAPQRS